MYYYCELRVEIIPENIKIQVIYSLYRWYWY